MDDVRRYDCTNGKAQHCYGCYEMTSAPEGDYVDFSDFNAQRLRADTAEAELAKITADRDSLKGIASAYIASDGEKDLRIAAAEQRIAELIGFIREASDSAQSAGMLKAYISQLDAALNPNPDCCQVSAEDQALLNAGEYTHEELFGVGGKPSCPKCFNPKPEAGSHES
jgi:hypothetical protein